uniref:Uncharacterized protein n=1 Tax=Cucumis sativus TaxID=3659 RepID=A0A0A0L9K8_CUCSA
MHVHSPTPDQRRVNLFPVIRCKNNDSLFPTTRPKSIRKVQKPRQRHAPHLLLVILTRRYLRNTIRRQVNRTINIFNHNHRPVRRLNKKRTKLRIIRNLRQFQIIHIVAEEIRHCRNQARFPRSRRSIKQIPTFPSTANSTIKLPPGGKRH